MKTTKVRLDDLATARSGDKGNHVNLGVIANDSAAYAQLVRSLTTEVVHGHFKDLGVTRVVRYELPRIQSLNFVLFDALAGGASRSLRMDTQGKLLGTMALEIELPA
jgi:hypothetical protein